MLKYVFVLIVAAGSPLLLMGFESAQEGVPDLIAKLNDGDPKVRAKAAQDIAELGPLANMAVPTLIERLEDTELRVRNLAYDALEKIGPVAAPELVRVLKGKAAVKTKAATELRVQIARILGSLRPESRIVQAALLEVFDDPDSNFKERTLAAVAYPPPPIRAALPKFVAIIQDKGSSPGLRRMAISCLRAFGASADKALPLVWDVWQDHGKPDLERSVAVHALVSIAPKHPDLVPSLRKVVSDTGEGWEIRAAAAQSLGQLGSLADAAIPDLVGVFKEKVDPTDHDRPYEFIRKNCLRTLAKIAPDSKAALQAVVDVAQSTTNGDDVRSVAIQEMPKFSGETVSVLISILTAEQFERKPATLYVSYAAVRALAAMGPRARAAAPILERIVKTTDRSRDQLRVEALGALDRIRAER